MEVIKTDIKDLVIIKPNKFNDTRGFFLEAYNQDRYVNQGILNTFVQDNFSSSKYGVIRGLHYQLEPFSQAKLIQVLKGNIIDCIIDLRKNSSTFGQKFEIELSEENGLQLFIPRGFAHGFSVISKEVLFTYKCDNTYNKESERGIIYNDPRFNIDWKIPVQDQIISDKDKLLPIFDKADFNF